MQSTRETYSIARIAIRRRQGSGAYVVRISQRGAPTMMNTDIHVSRQRGYPQQATNPDQEEEVAWIKQDLM